MIADFNIRYMFVLGLLGPQITLAPSDRPSDIFAKGSVLRSRHSNHSGNKLIHNLFLTVP